MLGARAYGLASGVTVTSERARGLASRVAAASAGPLLLALFGVRELLGRLLHSNGSSILMAHRCVVSRWIVAFPMAVLAAARQYIAGIATI